MNATPLWLVVGTIGLVALLFRASFFLFLGWIDDVPPWFERTLRFVPPAVFAAFVAPSVFAPDGTLALSPGNTRLVAGAIGGAVAWRTGSLFATVAVGMAAYGLAQAVAL